MKIGMVGLGKLGMPVATAMALKGRDVVGYDKDPARMVYSGHPEREAGPEGHGHYDDWLRTFDHRNRATYQGTGSLDFAPTIEDLVQMNLDIIFVAVETPHDPRYEGITPMPPERVDFDYVPLDAAMMELIHYLRGAGKKTPVAIISTVLPGTLRGRYDWRVGYNPSFIAMSTTMQDYLEPEFLLIGVDDDPELAQLIVQAHPVQAIAPPQIMDIVSAEMTKVLYNTMISQRIVFINAAMELAHKVGGDVDAVSGALCRATRRIVSTAYMRGGMGDGGGCHPRDNIALSWLAREHGLSHDIFEDIMWAREDQANWLVSVVTFHANKHNLDVGVLGYAYKPGTNLTIGSAALLCVDRLQRLGRLPRTYDHWVEDAGSIDLTRIDKRVWLIGCKHPELQPLAFPQGAVVVDPFRYIPDQDGVTVVRVGEN